MVFVYTVFDEGVEMFKCRLVVFLKFVSRRQSVRIETIYEYLWLFVMDIVTAYVPLYYGFHNVFSGALNLDFAAITALMKILCRILVSS